MKVTYDLDKFESIYFDNCTGELSFENKGVEVRIKLSKAEAKALAKKILRDYEDEE